MLFRNFRVILIPTSAIIVYLIENASKEPLSEIKLLLYPVKDILR